MKKEEYKDQGLRQALQRRNESADRMTLPEDFTDRLMQRLEEPTPTLPKGGRNKSLLYWGRLVGASIAASVLLLLTLHSLVGEEQGVGSVTSSLSTKKGRDGTLERGAKLQTPPPPLDGRGVAALPGSRQGVPTSLEAVADSKHGLSTSLEAVADSKHGLSTSLEAVADSKHGLSTSLEAVADSRQGVPTSVEALQIEYAQQTKRVQQAEPLNEVLTERDIPITRPENYKYTPEEIALMKKQAREAYLKWVELELEIAKYNQEQTANNYRDL